MKKRNIILISIFSIILGLSLGLSYLLKKNNFVFNFDFISFIKYFIIFSILSFIITSIILYLINKIKVKNGSFNNKKLCIICFLSIFLTGLLFLIVHYPGEGFIDTLAIIDDPILNADQHPLIYNLFIGGIFRVFKFIFDDINISYFCTSLFQLLLCSSVITFIVYWFNKNIKNKLSTIILVLYFSLLPIVSNYNTALIKDSIFGIIFLFYIPILYKIIKDNKILDNKKYLIELCILFIITCLFRNNGVYVVIFIILCLIITYRKYLKKLLLILLIAIICNKIPDLFINKDSLFQEKVGIPIQQIAYTIKNNGDSINSNDKEFINNIMDIELIKEKYNYSSVDAIKWDSSFNREFLDKNKIEFLKVWFNILPKNISSYTESYLLMTYNLWAIDSFNPIQSRFLEIDGDEYNQRSETFKTLKNENILPNELNNFYEKTTIYFNNGTLIFILLFINLYTLIKRKKKLLLLSIPLIGVYLTLMISAPISYALRYMSSYLYTLPFIILIIINYINEKKTN